jgi:energy-coupling factor transporter ATP-binding protein EcfA2/energy-coupling factor transporter transmembrane protein EcfT
MSLIPHHQDLNTQSTTNRSADEACISLEHVWVTPKENSFRDEPILRDIHCRLEPNTLTLIVGHTGSGKTTLLHALAGLIPLSQGSVSYGRHPLWDNNLSLNDTIHRSIGMVFQYPERQLFAESIEKEFRYSLKPYRLTKAEQSERIRLALNLMRLPETILAESFMSLSDGQKRKAALATTLATEPQWLLLDEPTAGMDPQGIQPLLGALRAQKKVPGGGVIVISHDLDTFLPLADRVLILQDGMLVANDSPEVLLATPSIWLRTGVGLPTSLELIMTLREHGILVNSSGESERSNHGPGGHDPGPFLSPSDMADAILQQLCPPAEAVSSQECETSGAPAVSSQPKSQASRQMDSIAIQTAVALPSVYKELGGSLPATVPESASSASSASSQMVREMHPIAKWFVYLLLSTGILLQHSWTGIGLAALTAWSCISISGVPYRSLLKPTKPFIYFILISTLISGIGVTFVENSWRPERMYFSIDSALQTFQLLSRFLLIMILGILLAVTTSGRRMQAGLEQALSLLERFRIPVAVFTFAATLLMRFLPILTQEMERTSMIVKARGKSRSKKDSLRLRDVPVFLIPFLLSMMKHAEDLSLALESRGYQFRRLRKEVAARVQWTKREWITAVIGLIVFLIFYGLDSLKK